MLRQSLMALTVTSLSSLVVIPTISDAAIAEPFVYGKNHGQAHLRNKLHGKRYYGKKHFKRKFKRGFHNRGFHNRGFKRGFKRGFRHGNRFGRHHRNNVFIGFGNGFYGNRFGGFGPYYGGFGHFGGFGGFYGRNYGGFFYGGNPNIHFDNIWHNRVRNYHIDRRYDYYPPTSYYAGGATSGNQLASTVLGGVLGGVIGSEIDGGRNRTAGILIGSAIGAALGNEVGRDLDAADRYYNDSYYDSYRGQNTVRVVEREGVTSRDYGGYKGDQSFEADGSYRAETEDYQPPREIRKCIRYQYRGGDYQCTKWTLEYAYDE
ncbi:glycine zipper 2TM domain-containing protein [Kordiimonas sp. SCSIO 12610]|uniref:glycine zipper 2TM domain-containing protein n=1 Tax=Kordiimonas sp. SCSIO 12610 TaxID=2829597 RepID=UPI00210DE08F|nr:glycine zipper 2TM domain-containing protein [Kordiimonas sp. SCSIO 12610]UTW56651.1 glycine zipper 2TM domain-containing protein [Kordiimonas sp. SCSIO 12610]